MVNIFGNYSVFTNADNEVMVTVIEREGEPKEPCIIYDGGEHALFYRTPETSFVLDYIDKDVRSAIKNAKTVLIAELPSASAEDTTRSYFVPIKIVAKMPPLLDLPSSTELENNPESLEKLAKKLIDDRIVTVENKTKITD